MAEKKKSSQAGRKPGGARKKDVKPREAKEKATKPVEEEEGLVGLSLDITWVAIIALVAFFIGFLVRGFFTPSVSNPSVPTNEFPQGITAPPIPEGVTTLPPGHPPVPGMETPRTTPTPPKEK